MRKLVLAGVLALVACDSGPETRETPDVTVESGVKPQILNGTPSVASQDAVVMLYWLDTVNNRLGGLCTATLVAPNLILTARHCVARTDDDVSCDSNGTPLIGGEVFESHNPQDLYVFTGVNRPAFAGDSPTTNPPLDTTKWQPASRGKTIIDDRASTLCNHDIAFVELETPITNTPIASMQLDGEPTANEKLLTVGWGVTTTENEPAVRQQRPNVTVKRNGPSDASPLLTKSEFLFDESICLGDSGGPIFVQSTSAILGVVSRGSNGNDPSQGGASFTCTQADNIGTKLSAFKQFITDTFKTYNATPKITAPPDTDDGCNVAHASDFRNWGLVGLALILVRRRRRASAS